MKVASIGDKIELKKVNSNGIRNNSNKTYMSQLLDIIDDTKIKISMPIEKGHIIPLQVGDNYILFIYSSKGLYSCKTLIMDRYRENNIYILDLIILSELKKIQRREYYRLGYRLEIDYHQITAIEKNIYKKLLDNSIDEEIDKNKLIELLLELEKERYKGTVINISGGGLCFQSKERLPQDALLLLFVVLNMNGKSRQFVLQAMILKSERILSESDTYEHRAKFMNLAKEDREYIIQFIFEEERKQRQQERRIN